MNSQSFTLAERLIPSTYLQQAASSKRSRENLIRVLIEQVDPFKYFIESRIRDHPVSANWQIIILQTIDHKSFNRDFRTLPVEDISAEKCLHTRCILHSFISS